MAEAFAAVGLAASIVTFVDVSGKVIARLREYHSISGEAPRIFHDTKTQLPLLVDIMTRIKKRYRDGSLATDPQRALSNVVEGCLKQITILDGLIEKMLPTSTDSTLQRARKAVASIHKEKDVVAVQRALRGYEGTLTLYFSERFGASTAAATRTAKAYFLVPFAKDLQFVGREDIIENIEHRLKITPRVALAGIGGVGKSQVAIEYCHRFKAQHPNGSVFWVHASTVARVDQAYKDIARKLGLPGWEDPKVNNLQLVSEWLSDKDHGTWLMVLDNADENETFFSALPHESLLKAEQPVSLISYLPRSSKGFIIITTRDARIGERLADREKSIVVLPLPVQEAERLLRSKLSQHHEWHDVDTAELLDTLGYLPLAITQAAAFISENGITLTEYMETLRTSDLDLTDLLSQDLHDPRRDLNAPRSVVLTWKLSFDQIQKQKPRAAQLLSLMAILDRQGVPKSLLRGEDDQRTEFTTALGTLQAFSLITAEQGGETFIMHRLVQLATQHWLELQKAKEIYQEEAMKLLSRRFPSGEHENWKICEVLYPHAQMVLEYNYTSKSSLLHRATLLYNVAWYERQQGRYEIAYRSSKEAHDAHQRLLHEDNSKVLNSLGLLALILESQGKYEAAEKMNRRALDGYEKTLGKEHPSTLTSVSNLALALKSQGKYEAAEKMNRRALDGYEKTLGKEHPSTLTSVSNLALVLKSQGKYEAAEKMNRRALDGKEKALGKEHPSTLTSVSNLASVLESQGKYEAAEKMNRRALDGSEKTLGKEHPSTLTSVSNLAGVLERQGKYEAAEEMNRRALDGSEKALGKEHPDTLTSVNNLAGVLERQGKYEAAEEMNRRALDGSEKALGKEHPSTLTSVSNLAGVLERQGKYEAAEEMDRRALDGREKTLGKEHPDTLTSVNNLAVVLERQGKYEAAEEMSRRALDGKEKALGKEHPSTLTSVYCLAFSLHRQKKYEDASKLYQRACAGYEKCFGLDHPTFKACSSHYSSMLDEMERGSRDQL